MAQFVRAGQRLINLEHIVHIRVWPADGEETGLMVDVVTTATLDKDPTDKDSVSEAFIVLEDEDAREFLRSVQYQSLDREFRVSNLQAADLMHPDSEAGE